MTGSDEEQLGHRELRNRQPDILGFGVLGLRFEGCGAYGLDMFGLSLEGCSGSKRLRLDLETPLTVSVTRRCFGLNKPSS